MATDEAQFVSERIRSVLQRSKSLLLTGDSADLCRIPVLDNHYAVTVRLLLFAAIVGRFLTCLFKLSLTFPVSGQRTRNSVDHKGTIALISTERLLQRIQVRTQCGYVFEPK